MFRIDDYRRTFNLGIGMMLAVPAAGERSAAAAEAILKKLRGAELSWRARWWRRSAARAAWGIQVKRSGILLSGRGSNFEAIARQRCGG